jgi:hypothetical protein
MTRANSASALDLEFSIDTGLIVFTRDGRALFGWRDLNTGLYHGEADGICIPDAIGAIVFASDLVH